MSEEARTIMIAVLSVPVFAVVLSAIVYMVVKAGALGYFRAKSQFDDTPKPNEGATNGRPTPARDTEKRRD